MANCKHCGQPITYTLLRRQSHRECRERARSKAQYAGRLERRIEAIYRAQRRAA
jgi:hypothetical protein